MPGRLRPRSLRTPSPSRTRAVTPTAAERIASSHQTFPSLGSGDGPGSVLFTGLASKRVLKKAFSCFDRLSTNGKSPTIALPAPFALSLSKGERRVFQQPVRLTAERQCLWWRQIRGRPMSQLEMVNDNIRRASAILELGERVEKLLLTPDREVKVEVAVELDNGE